ncbi:MAG TPA: GGDEF domain-containing protein, partial [Candidatus Dormibacteraeota bacterium]
PMTPSRPGGGSWDLSREPAVHDPRVRQASLVGRAEPALVLRRGGDAETLTRLRAELAKALGIEPASVRKLPDHEVVTALKHVRGLLGRAVELEARVTIDDLTGVLRRGPGLATLGDEIQRARRLDLGLAVAFIDVDGLKAINDVDGHSAGDAVLLAVATTLRRGLRSYDLVMRYGGDEFICVLFGADLGGAERLLVDVRAAIEAATGGVSVSVGLAQLARDDDTETLLRRADDALLDERSQRRAAPAV